MVLQPGPLAQLMPDEGYRDRFAGSGAQLVDDATIVANLHPFKWRFQIGWSLSALGQAKLSGAGADDGLVDPHLAIGDAVAVTGLYGGVLQALRAGPAGGRTDGHAGDGSDRAPVRLWRARHAGGGGQVLAAGGLCLVEGTVRTSGAKAIAAARNVAAIVRDVPEDWASWGARTLVLASFAADAGGDVVEFLERASPEAASPASFGERTAKFWEMRASTGWAEAGLERLPALHLGLALGPPGLGLGWYYKMPRRPALTKPQSTVGFMHLNVGRLLAALSETANP